MPIPAPPGPRLPVITMSPPPAQPASHRHTRSPRLRPGRGALWLGAGLCLATLLLLRGSDTPREERE